MGALGLPEKIVSFSDKAPVAREATSSWVWNYSRYTGRFSSDANAWMEKDLIGDGTPVTDDGDIQLNISYDKAGHFSGEIHSKIMAETFLAPWSRVMISGEVGVTGTFHGEVWDIVRGEKVLYARFHLNIDDSAKGTLRLTPLHPDDGIFSGEIVLWPTNTAMSDGLRGRRFYESLMRTVNGLRKE